MTTPTDSGHEPADLGELTATDALLDRLGARDPSDDDLRDPAAAALVDLLAVIDQSHEADVAAVRLIEVLAGRPLYITGAESAVAEAPLIIDLTDHEDLEAEESKDDVSEPVGARDPLTPVGHLPRPVVPIRIGEMEPVVARRWERALSHVSLPAASVLLLIAVGGGVSAAVTGNPMTPVNGISRVMAQLPGVDDGVDRVKLEINAARQAAQKNDPTGATMHLDKARDGLADVPNSDRTDLTKQIEAVQTMVATLPPPTDAPSGPESGLPSGSGSGPGSGSGSGSVATTPAVQVPVSPSPSQTATDSPATHEPTPEASESEVVVPPTEAPAQTTEAATEATPETATTAP